MARPTSSSPSLLVGYISQPRPSEGCVSWGHGSSAWTTSLWFLLRMCKSKQTHMDGRYKQGGDWPMETHFSRCTLGCSFYIYRTLHPPLYFSLSRSFLYTTNTIFSILTSARFSPRLLACFAVTMTHIHRPKSGSPLQHVLLKETMSMTRRFLPTSFGIPSLKRLGTLFSFCLHCSTILDS